MKTLGREGADWRQKINVISCLPVSTSRFFQERKFLVKRRIDTDSFEFRLVLSQAIRENRVVV